MRLYCSGGFGGSVREENRYDLSGKISADAGMIPTAIVPMLAPCGTSLTKGQNLTYNEDTRVDYTSKYLGQARNIIEKNPLE